MGLLLPRLSAAGHPERPAVAIAGAATAHAALIALVAVVVPAEELKQAFQPMAVRLVELLPERPPAPPPEPPRARKSPPALPLLTANAPADAPSTFTVPPQPPAPAQTPAIDVAPSPAPEQVTAARFDADYLDNPKPVYPHASRRLGEQGKVLLRVFVSAQGLAERIEVKLSSGFARLDQAAHEAVSRWRFVPARRGEQAIAAWVQVPITFQLDS